MLPIFLRRMYATHIDLMSFGILCSFISFHKGGSHGRWSRLFEVGSLMWYIRRKKTRPVVSLLLSAANLCTHLCLMNARFPVMPFMNAGIIKSRWYPWTSSLALNSFMRRSCHPVRYKASGSKGCYWILVRLTLPGVYGMGRDIQIKVHRFFIQGHYDPILVDQDYHVNIVYLFRSLFKYPF